MQQKFKFSKVKAVFLKHDRDQEHARFFGFFILEAIQKSLVRLRN